MLKEIINNLIKNLDVRQKDVITTRFGLKGEKLTLAAVGEKYHLTRERIRQIEEISLKLIGEKAADDKQFNDFVGVCVNHLKKIGGIMKEEKFLNDIRDLFKDESVNQQQLKFIFEVAGGPKFYRQDGDFYGFWHLDDKAFSAMDDFINKLAKLLSAKKEEVLKQKKFNEIFSSFVRTSGISESLAKNYIAVSKKFKTNSFGEFGLSQWEEINPQTIGAKTYLILKKRGQSLHFREIAEEINKAKFDKRPALPQTVHNELIKDPRFVLVGRGMYGLSEFGLKPGAAQEVIKRILKEKGPLAREKVIDLVLQERFLKPNTVLLNLQNKKHFKKLADGRYHIA
ncbi:MAG: sigma factor-like helix-turn-helix DNA-binding protein [Patescibacteria group bacterium]